MLTSTQVLDLPSTDGSTPITSSTRVTFLDEFRIVVLTPEDISGVLGFTLFDTLVPRDHPVDSMRFGLPPRYHNWLPIVCVDYDRCFGAPDRGRPFTTDPTQAIIVVKLDGPDGSCVFLIVRTQTLIEHVRLVGADAWIPWNVWGRNTVVMEIPQSEDADGSPYPTVQGVRVVLMKRSAFPGVHGYRLQLCAFGFGPRGWNTLPLRDEGDGPERRARFEDGQDLLFRGERELVEWGFDSLGDGRFLHLVSRFRC